MSNTNALPPGAKKAVHVKWAGKTIALGTFPAAEADEKCARAKALTRAWRSTMRPKPSREWVMLELERLNVRVVSGRLGRKDDTAAESEGATPADAPGSADRKASIGWNPSDDFDSMMQRRSSSIGFNNRSGSLGLGSEERRPFVGGGSAAAYEAARADHYGSMGGQGDGRGSLGMGGGGGMSGMAVNPNQHYEMLKLHHMNLLNEIQETTLMMNLYQQQQLQQQQEQLQRESAADAGSGGGGQMFGGPGGSGGGAGGGTGTGATSSKADELVTAQEQQQELEERLRLIKEDIASRQKEVDEQDANGDNKGGTKRKADDDNEEAKGEEDGGDKKRTKTDKEEKKEVTEKEEKSEEEV